MSLAEPAMSTSTRSVALREATLRAIEFRSLGLSSW